MLRVVGLIALLAATLMSGELKPQFWIYGVGGIVAFLIGSAIASDKYRAQKLADGSASSIIESGRFALYLRPFAWDETWKHKPSLSVWSIFSASSDDRPVARISKAVERRLGQHRCIAVSSENEGYFGPSRIETTDQRWMGTVEDLVRKSSCIVLLLGPGLGVLTEIDLILSNGALTKTVVVVPSARDFKAGSSAALARVRWRVTRDQFQRHGVELPEIQERPFGLVWRQNTAISFPLMLGFARKQDGRITCFDDALGHVINSARAPIEV